MGFCGVLRLRSSRNTIRRRREPPLTVRRTSNPSVVPIIYNPRQMSAINDRSRQPIGLGSLYPLQTGTQHSRLNSSSVNPQTIDETNELSQHPIALGSLQTDRQYLSSNPSSGDTQTTREIDAPSRQFTGLEPLHIPPPGQHQPLNPFSVNTTTRVDIDASFRQPVSLEYLHLPPAGSQLPPFNPSTINTQTRREVDAPPSYEEAVAKLQTSAGADVIKKYNEDFKQIGTSARF